MVTGVQTCALPIFPQAAGLVEHQVLARARGQQQHLCSPIVGVHKFAQDYLGTGVVGRQQAEGPQGHCLILVAQGNEAAVVLENASRHIHLRGGIDLPMVGRQVDPGLTGREPGLRRVGTPCTPDRCWFRGCWTS